MNSHMTTDELSDASSAGTSSPPSLVVIILALNEEATIADVIGVFKGGSLTSMPRLETVCSWRGDK